MEASKLADSMSKPVVQLGRKMGLVKNVDQVLTSHKNGLTKLLSHARVGIGLDHRRQAGAPESVDAAAELFFITV